jgi:hypothetical protein
VLKLSGVNFQKMGMPDLPPDAAAAMSETIQHTLYGGLLMPFAVLGCDDLRRQAQRQAGG